ncbi:hypothetical protein COO60DRAFT_512637 [Scenedesmus sp. NREL 46B-D3]|nr:hypothetical protein COO60DRAFT_512637 [Scenedesmus sp. NREL 46B-D3]
MCLLLPLLLTQVCLALDKRVLLEGLGASPQQVLLDHRANHPAFNVTRCCILRNFAVDMVGFCEAVAISSVACIKPILQQLHISCSGDDCVLVGGSAQPLLQQCTIQARRCGVKQHAASSTTLWSCTISGGTHGLVVCGHSQAFLEGCTVQDCSQDGIVVLQQAGVHLSHSSVSGCRGPAVDVCDDGTASLKHVDISECCGGVWLWQRANCEAVSSYISGGSSYAVLLDQQAYARGSSCSIDGPCHDSSEAPPPLLAHGTTALHPHGSAGESSSSSSTTRHGPGNYAGADASAAAASADADDIPLRQKHGAGSAQQFQTVAAQPPQQQHDTEMWQDPSAAGSTLKPCSHLQCSSPFSTGACSDNSSPDMLVYMAGSSKAEFRGCLVDSEMLVQDAAAAAALFPAEQGSFAVEQRLY